MNLRQDGKNTSPFRGGGVTGLALALFMLAAGPGLPAFGETEPGTAGEGRVILERAADFYGGLKTVSASMVVHIELPKSFGGGMPMEPLKYELALEQPASAAFTPAGGDREPSFIQNGKQQYMVMPPFGQYMLRESPATMAGLIVDDEGQGPIVPGAGLVAGFGLAAGTVGALRDADQVTLLGEEAVGEIPCHHLALTGGAFAGEVWVTRGDQPWILRCLSAAPPEASAEPKPDEQGMVMVNPRLDFRFSGWDAEPDLAGRFEIKPDEKLKKVDQFAPPSGGMGGPGKDPAQDHPSLNQPAPEATLQPLEGEPVSLSSLKGKVVVLDFWATWCKPCVMSMPGVAALAKEMKGREVVFFAVNQMEGREKVTAFLEQEKLDIPVALDADGSSARAFGVRGIPHLVVIGPDGVVRQVHIGYAPGGAARLKTEVEALLK